MSEKVNKYYEFIDFLSKKKFNTSELLNLKTYEEFYEMINLEFENPKEIFIEFEEKDIKFSKLIEYFREQIIKNSTEATEIPKDPEIDISYNEENKIKVEKEAEEELEETEEIGVEDLKEILREELNKFGLDDIKEKLNKNNELLEKILDRLENENLNEEKIKNINKELSETFSYLKELKKDIYENIETYSTTLVTSVEENFKALSSIIVNVSESFVKMKSSIDNPNGYSKFKKENFTKKNKKELKESIKITGGMILGFILTFIYFKKRGL